MFALKLPSQIKEGSSQTAYVAAQQRKAETLAKQQAEAKAAIAPSPDEKIASPIAKAAIAAAAAQRLQVQSSADEWSSVREAVRMHQREDDAASLASTPTTFSRVSFLPSDHSQQRVVERGISEYQIKQAKVSGCMSLAVRFDDDYLEQQAITKAREWGEQLKAALGLSLGDAKPKGPPGDRRIEVELVGWPSLVGWPLLNDAESQAEAFLPSTMAGAFLPSTITGALKDWEERVSSSCGRVYYHNPKIGKSMWTRPSVGWPLLNDAESGASATPKMSHVESPRLIGTYPMPPKTDFLLDASTSAPPMALEVHALSDILTAKPTVMKQISKAPQVLAATVWKKSTGNLSRTTISLPFDAC